MLATESAPEITSGDTARQIVDARQHDIEDYSRVEELEREFPTLACQLGRNGLYLANVADNRAGTFKIFGALVGMSQLQAEGNRAARLFSAGNHARGATEAARLLGMELHVGVPTTAPPAKSEVGLRELWDSPLLHVHAVGATLEETRMWMEARPKLGAFLHPFDNPHVIAGQGTVADTILDSEVGLEIKHIVTPIGGGGLAAGIVRRLDERGRSDIIVHAVEGPRNDSASRSLAASEIVNATGPNGRFGGAAVLRMGELAFATLSAASNFRIHSVSADEVAALTEEYAQDRYDLWRQDTPAFEPTSLVAIAGLAHIARDHPGELAVAVGTGYNDSLWTQ